MIQCMYNLWGTFVSFGDASFHAGARGQEDFGFAPWPAGPLPKGCTSVFWVTPAPHFTDTF